MRTRIFWVVVEPMRTAPSASSYRNLDILVYSTVAWDYDRVYF